MIRELVVIEVAYTRSNLPAAAQALSRQMNVCECGFTSYLLISSKIFNLNRE